jgi:hypothetical protein
MQAYISRNPCHVLYIYTSTHTQTCRKYVRYTSCEYVHAFKHAKHLNFLNLLEPGFAGHFLVLEQEISDHSTKEQDHCRFSQVRNNAMMHSHYIIPVIIVEPAPQTQTKSEPFVSSNMCAFKYLKTWHEYAIRALQVQALLELFFVWNKRHVHKEVMCVCLRVCAFVYVCMHV